MKRDEVLSTLAAYQEELKWLGVKSLDLFGSAAWDEAGPNSDVDFLSEFDQLEGLFQLISNVIWRIF